MHIEYCFFLGPYMCIRYICQFIWDSGIYVISNMLKRYSVWNWFIDPHFWGTFNWQHVCSLCLRSSLPEHTRIQICLVYILNILDLSYLYIDLYTSIYQHLVEKCLVLWCFPVSSLPKHPRWICECGAPNLMSWSHCTKCGRPPRQDRWCERAN